MRGENSSDLNNQQITCNEKFWKFWFKTCSKYATHLYLKLYLILLFFSRSSLGSCSGIKICYRYRRHFALFTCSETLILFAQLREHAINSSERIYIYIWECGNTALPQNDTMYCGQHYEQVTSASRNVTFGPVTAPMLSPQKGQYRRDWELLLRTT